MDHPYIAVVGAGDFDDRLGAIAEDIGGELGRRGCVLLCGGLGGVMEAACRGAKAEGGTTIGILPGTSRADANAYVDVAIPTGMGEMRNALIVRSADAVIAVGGGYGTLSEIAFALKTGTAVVGIDAWELSKDGASVEAFPIASSATEAVDIALALVGEL